VSAPAPRRHCEAVYIRDGWRCSAPACTSRRNLEARPEVSVSGAMSGEVLLLRRLFLGVGDPFDQLRDEDEGSKRAGVDRHVGVVRGVA